MNSHDRLTAEELWKKITTINTTHEWMQLTNGFSIFTIYHHCRILSDQKRVETYHCLLCKEYPKSLEAFDAKDLPPYCYMMMGDGNQRRSSNPAFFDLLLEEGVRCAINDGPYTAQDLAGQGAADGEAAEAGDNPAEFPLRLQYAAFEALLAHFDIGPSVNDRTKIIRLFCCITGRGLRSTRNIAYSSEGVSPQYQGMIDEVNKAFAELNIPIEIKPRKAVSKATKY